MSVELTPHSGKASAFKRELATPGCDPLAKVRITKHRRSFTLAAILTAARRGPDLTRARIALPKQLKRGRYAPRLSIDGKKAKAGHPRRSLSRKLSGGARRVKLVWKGLARVKGKRLGRTLIVPIVMKDERGKVTTLRVRVRRG